MRPILALIPWFICLKILLTGSSIFAQQDLRHYSKVFKAERPYRIFLPSDYEFSKKSIPSFTTSMEIRATTSFNMTALMHLLTTLR